MNEKTESTGRRVLAVGLDLALALAAGLIFFASAVVIVTVLVMTTSGAPMPATLLDLGPAAWAFWAFELLIVTPMGWLSVGAVVAIATLGWLSHRGMIARRSPGMVLAGIARRPSRG
jgi:hypothetical protein